MATNNSNPGGNAGNSIKSGVTKLHGLGEAIRGNVNAFADNITNTDSSKSNNVAARGTDEMRSGVYEGTGAGVTPKDTPTETVNRAVQGEPASERRVI